MTKYVVIGKIGSTHGVQGWVKLTTYTEHGSNILNYAPWYLEMPNGEWKPIIIEHSKVQGDRALIKIAGFDSPEAARSLTNKCIAITRTQLPDLSSGEYYWADLEGLTVLDLQGQVIGKVASLFETGANDILVVKGKKEYNVPFLFDTVIIKIDLAQQTITIDWDFT